ncbi:uncharacterized protein LOC123672321 [Harmonia axyridis]|uniref:uncharacterized protein LOC123672321 n=1 Tax=Harmonia axyridis TaxID=115357 RepID=UPI001E277B42|nr:uncharacterized protein LOC123672321 [Harmonia axyridis]
MANTNKIKQARALRTMSENQIIEIKAFADEAKIDINKRAQFKILCQNLDSYREEFKSHHQTLISLMAINDEDISKEETNRKDFDFNYSYIETVLQEFFEVKPSVTTSASAIGDVFQTSNHNVKLPKIEIPKFTGDIKTFKPFIDMFENLIHNNTSLSNIEKFNYLISSLRGPPLTLVQTTPMSSANYAIAFKSLSERYNNKRLIAFAHFQEIDNAIIIKNSKNTQSLRILLDTYTENLAALENMGIPVKEWDFMLYYLFTKHLDQETISRFEFENPVAFDELPSFKKLVAFVQQRCNTLDAIDLSVGKSSNTLSPSSKNVPNFSSHSRPKQSSTYFANASKGIKNSTITCSFCKQDHTIYKCSEYHNRTPNDRSLFVKQNKLCTNCLSSQHSIYKCRSKSTCHFCHERHHSSIHVNKDLTKNYSSSDNLQVSSQTTQPLPSTSKSPDISTFSGMMSSAVGVLLSTAIVEVSDSYSNFQKVRVILDSGSQTSYITEKCANRLGLSRFSCSLSIQGLGNMTNMTSKSGVTCKIKPVGKISPIFTIDAVVLPKLCANMPVSKLNHTHWVHLNNIQLADDSFHKPAPVDMLLGADIFPHILKEGRVIGHANEPVAINTIFGYILMGKYNAYDTHITANVSTFFAALGNNALSVDNLIGRFWEVEEVPSVKSICSPENALCEKIFAETHERGNFGRYTVNLPFKNSEPSFDSEDIRSIALRRFYSLERRLYKQPTVFKQYSDFLNEYLKNDYMEEVEVENSDNPIAKKNIFYLPHHCVMKDSTTTQLRVVFDGSTRSKGISLNDTLLVGEKLQNNIFEILLKFRVHSIVFTADIKKMFLQILINSKHQDYQRILWRFSRNDQVREYRLKRLVFGLSSSPFIANRVILQLARDERNDFPLAANILEDDIYIDDVCSGCSSLEEAKLIRDQLINILNRGCFELRKWASNTPLLLDDLPIEYRYNNNSSISFDDENSCIKVLGLRWQPSLDAFIYTIDSTVVGYTKRQILSDIAKIFDPLGFLAPLTCFAKLIMQRLWTLGLNWDDTPPREICEKWYQFKSSFAMLSDFKISRRFLVDNCDECQIHAFCDASEKAYAGVIYFRVQQNSKVNVFFVCAKTKVAPLKSISVPRLELCAAVLLSNLLSEVLTIFDNKIKFSNVYAYTDSMIVVHWIKSSPHKWKTFVSNRVTHIQDKIPPASWQHISIDNNPADCASRGFLPGEILQNKLWFSGPEWLQSSSEYWPVTRSSIKRVVSGCKQCWRLSPRPYQPPMGNLPDFRVSQLKAFSVVGLDYAGPFAITLGKIRGAKTHKAYICLFVCMATKCIHLELASDMTCEIFISALRRFIARRGRCDCIISDCGTNFTSASREIGTLMKQAAERETIKFKFNPPGSPHFAGMAEAGVKSVKTHIHRVVGQQIMTYEEFYTLLTQIEALLNSRPLCPMSNDPNDLSVLTPGHFLTLEPLTSLPDPDLAHLNISKLNRFQFLQRCVQSFWKRWQLEYLHTLQQRSKWLNASHPIGVGTIVLIKNDQTSPMKWLVGRIQKLYYGKDEVARVADVRTKNGVLKRALVKLCPLPSAELSNGI